MRCTTTQIILGFACAIILLIAVAAAVVFFMGRSNANVAVQVQPGVTIMYDITDAEFMSHIPDFLAFSTGGTQITTEDNANILINDVQGFAEVHYTFHWNESHRTGFNNLLAGMGFEMMESEIGMSDWFNDYVFVGLYFIQPDRVLIFASPLEGW